MRNEVQLQELYEGLYDGPHATPKPSEEGPIFLGIKNITEDGRLDLNNIRHISESEFARWTKRVTPREGDIVFSYEATLHRYAIIPRGFRGCLGRRMALIRPDIEKVNTDYLFYYLFSDEWREEVGKYILTGATVDRIPLTKTPEFKVKIPGKKEQDEIASIIKAYDNLIENNNRRIAILEEMAQSLYREWFVNFRFPGHEHTKFIDSPLGKIPEGWEVAPLDSIVETIIDYRGKTPKKLGGDWQSEGISALSALNVKNGSLIRLNDCKKISETLYEKWMKEKLKPGDILLTSEAPLGECCLLYEKVEYCLSQRLFAIRVKKNLLSPEYLFLALFSGHLLDELMKRATGATVSGIRQALLREVPVLVPNNEINEAFLDLVRPILALRNKLNSKNKNLIEQRDLLLPKLISGSIGI